ncbi:MAG: clostripain-related cysteine peptidase, partial [Candidatus Heimdallarchaeota archaeon]
MKTRRSLVIGIITLIMLLNFSFLFSETNKKIMNGENDFETNYQKFLNAQKEPLISAGEELFLLEGQIWQRKYGEKEFYLSPTMTDLERKEYDFRINLLDDKENGIKKSKFHFVKVDVSQLSISLLAKMGIKVPFFIKKIVNVYLPEIDIDELLKNNIKLSIVENYGNASGNYIVADDKSKATIWSNNFEGSFPTSDYSVGDSNSNNGSDYWDDVSEDKYEGSRSLWCADIGDQPNCGNYDDNMDAYVTLTSGINLSDYTDVQFSYAVKYNTEVNYDYLYRYYSTNGTSWTQSTTVYNGNSNGWSVKAFNITGFTNYYWKFRFTSDYSVHNYYGASIDIVKLTGNQAGLAAPIKVSPANNATLTTTTPTFSVQSVSGATNYGWWIKENGNVVIDPWNNGGWTSGTSFTPASGILQLGHNYTWDCRAYNGDGWGEQSSGYWSFKIQYELAKWTIMCYQNGDNNLEGACISDLNKMEQANDSNDINVITQIDRIPGYDSSNGNWTGTRRYKVKHDTNTSTIGSTLIQDMGELDMGNPNTLVSYCKWVIQNYPAEKYMLMIYDHGNGWYKDGEAKDFTKGVSWDNTDGNHIGVSNGELASALNQIKNELGKNIDILHFDACLMQMWEVLDITRNYVNYQIGSEDIGHAGSTDYKNYLNSLVANTSMSSKDLAKLVEQHCNETANSCIDLSKVNNLTIKIDTFADKLIQARGEGYTSEIEDARDSSFEMDSPDWVSHIDLGHFTYKIAHKTVPQYLKDAANNVRNYMFSDAVISKHFEHSKNHQNLYYDLCCDGIAIYHPEDHNDYNDSYNNLPIAATTNWDEYISTEGSSGSTEYSDNFESGFGNWTNVSGDNFDWTR